MTRDKILGMFEGVAVGDALGAAVEGWSAEQIAKRYGRMATCQTAHDRLAGTTTDDWQLTRCVAESLLAHGLDMDAVAAAHIEAFKQSTNGWGRSTRESVRSMMNGVHWSASGQTPGLGNGVAMKIAPVAAYALKYGTNWAPAIDYITQLAQMTHKSSVAVSSGLAQFAAINCCLQAQSLGTKEVMQWFIWNIRAASLIGRAVLPETLKEDQELFLIFEKLSDWENYDTAKIIAEFGGGSCRCYDSLPFTYMFFLKNPHSIESMYDVVNAGGDTDTNASMIGALLGALNGMEVFPKDLIESLTPEAKNDILSLANRFADVLGYE